MLLCRHTSLNSLRALSVTLVDLGRQMRLTEAFVILDIRTFPFLLLSCLFHTQRFSCV